MIQICFWVSLYFRMNTNNTQIGHIPTESLVENNNDNDSNIDQLLSSETVIISQQPMIQFNATNMIPSQIPLIPSRIQLVTSHVSQYENPTRRQLGRRRRRQRQRQRRQQGRQEQFQQRERQRQRPYQQRGRQQQRQRQYQQQERQQQRQQLQQETRSPRYRRWSSLEREQEYWEWIGFPEYMEENISPVLEAYYWETMNPDERQEIWEQNYLNELERNAALEQIDPWDYLEAFAILEHLALIQDQIEQMHHIDEIEKIEEIEQQQQNDAEQIQLQQWEQDQFEGVVIEEPFNSVHEAIEQ
jgi:hypothetical protein